MKLYGSYTSPFVRHCRIALLQSGFDFEFIETDYAGSAEQSPSAKVPFFSDADVQLSDSSSILKYIRERSGKDFLADLQDFENYALVNTLMDSAINIFLLEKSGVDSTTNDYLLRQKARVKKGLEVLNERFSTSQSLGRDSDIRCATFIDWGIYRQRFSIEDMDHLKSLLELANKNETFLATSPPK